MNACNWRIYGKINGRNKGGAFFGFLVENDEPAFGGDRLINALVFWSKTKEQVQEACDKIKLRYPNCECAPKKC